MQLKPRTKLYAPTLALRKTRYTSVRRGLLLPRVTSLSRQLLHKPMHSKQHGTMSGGNMIGFPRSPTVNCGMLTVHTGLNCRWKSSS